LRSVLLLPVMVTAVISAALLLQTHSLQPGWGLSGSLAGLLIATGAVLVAAGLTLMVKTIALLARIGRGTLAPWDPTQNLVVVGPYRHVRNPMISGVLAVLLGESLILGSTAVLSWTGFFLLANLTYIPLVEEPGLARRFGDSYRLYKANVPRWWPRRKAWQPPAAPGENE
ncbi:MAG: isoprenylcysteine carboxylmethyltransferase family protein, partial [Chloroflexota bacterium]